MRARADSRRSVLGRLGGWLGVMGLGAGGSVLAAGARPRPGRAQQEGPRVVEVALAEVPPGEILQVEWQGKPVFVRHRTEDEIVRERAVPLDTLRDPARDEERAVRPEWIVVEGSCTHGGCIPNGPLGDFGGWYCLCHGSQFDTAGRVRTGPARENLKIPPHVFRAGQRLVIGRDLDGRPLS